MVTPRTALAFFASMLCGLRLRLGITSQRLQLALLVVVVFAVIVYVSELPFFGCGDSVVSESVSPNGQLVAVVFLRNCGATTGYSTQVSLRRSAEPFDSEKQSPFLILDDDGKVVLSWREQSRLVIRLPREPKVVRKESEQSGVSIEYEATTESG